MIRVIIPTYKRSAMCKRTVDAVLAECPDADVHVYMDGATSYTWKRGNMHSLAKKPGREYYYQVWNRILADAKCAEWDHVLALPDDFTATPNAITRCAEIYERGECDVLVPVVDKRGRGPCWVPVDPVKKGDLWQTGWLDGCFYADRRMLEALDWRVPDFPPEHFQTNQSSGVGKYMSLDLHAMGLTISQVEHTLYTHGDHESRMHKEHRRVTPL